FGVGVEQLFASYLDSSSKPNDTFVRFALTISGILRKLINTLIGLLGGNTSFFRNFIRFTPYKDTLIYIVSRDDFQSDNETVVAHKVKIKGEIIHFAVDYQNIGDKITLHVGHNSAWDVAEWLREEDRKVDSKVDIPIGMHLGPTDINLMGRYVIKVSSYGAKIVESKTRPHPICTWGLALYTYNNIKSEEDNGKWTYKVHNVDKIDKIYWTSLGLWQELTVDFMLQQYMTYLYRQISLNTVRNFAEQNIPSCLFCLDTESLSVEDYYEFPTGYIGGSQQFVPKSERDGAPIRGHIVCVVFTPEESQIWIFDANNLRKGPVCKLRSDKLNIGMSLHTAWLPEICDRQSSENPNEEYKSLVDQLLDSVEKFSFMKPSQKKELQWEIKSLFPDFEQTH
ncbi:MAG: hypothetical protein F6K35_30140, partial [Okeania sp. SIO2H7]|nr:hypothetical protein [Okeania sp. SIO2H7]